MRNLHARRAIITMIAFAVALFVVQFSMSAVAFAQGTAAPTQPAISGVVTSLVLGSAASMPTGYLVGFFKHAYPSSSGKALIIVAVLSGLLSSVLMTMLEGGVQLTQVGVATVITQGIGAAALSAGIGATNASGDEKRKEA